MKPLVSDYRNLMSLNSITAELHIRLNTSLSCTDMYKYLLSGKELTTAIHSNNKYISKNSVLNKISIFFYIIICFEIETLQK